MALEKTFNKLRINLYKSFIFYIPKNIFPAEQLDLIEDVDQFLDKVIVINEYGAIYELTNQPFLVSILQKQKLLDANLFKLLDREAKLKNTQFDFFIKKYLELVNVCLYISRWLNNNVESSKLEMSVDVKNAFQFQYNFFQKHFDQINQHFNSTEKAIPQAPQDIAQFIENNFKELKESLTSHYDDKGVMIDNKAGKELQVEDLPKSKQRQKKVKPVLITEREAESFLLKTVFDLNI